MTTQYEYEISALISCIFVMELKIINQNTYFLFIAFTNLHWKQ